MVKLGFIVFLPGGRVVRIWRLTGWKKSQHEGRASRYCRGHLTGGTCFSNSLAHLTYWGDARDHWFFRIPYPLKLQTIYRYRIPVSCNVMCFFNFWQHILGVKFIFTVPVSTERFFSFVLSTTVHFSFFHGPLLKFPNCTSKLGHMSGCQSGIRCTESEFF